MALPSALSVLWGVLDRPNIINLRVIIVYQTHCRISDSVSAWRQNLDFMNGHPDKCHIIVNTNLVISTKWIGLHKWIVIEQWECNTEDITLLCLLEIKFCWEMMHACHQWMIQSHNNGSTKNTVTVWMPSAIWAMASSFLHPLQVV